MSGDRGSVRYHRGGWELRVQIDGQKMTRRHRGPNTRAGRAEAEKALDALIARHSISPDGMDAGTLVDRYAATCSADWSPSTRRQIPAVRAALVRHLGGRPIETLRLMDIETAYIAMAAEGTKAGTIRRRHGVLHAALGHAVRWGVIAANPAHQAKVPTGAIRRGEGLPLVGDVLAAVDRLDHERLRMAARLAVATGLRRGELVALRWSDVDLDAGVVRSATALAVGADGVSRKGRKFGATNVLSIDEYTAAEVKAWRATCLAAALEMGLGLGPDDPVLPSPEDPSRPWHPERLSHTWGAHRASVGLDAVRWHDLRHLHATSLLAAGIPATTVAARLGHASTKMTLDVYGHAVPAQDRDAADVIGRAQRPDDGGTVVPLSR
jgi:integrase